MSFVILNVEFTNADLDLRRLVVAYSIILLVGLLYLCLQIDLICAPSIGLPIPPFDKNRNV